MRDVLRKQHVLEKVQGNWLDIILIRASLGLIICKIREIRNQIRKLRMRVRKKNFTELEQRFEEKKLLLLMLAHN